MANYRVNAESAKKLKLYENQKLLGELSFENLFLYECEIRLSGGKVYQIKPKGFWGTTIELLENNVALINFKMHWVGDIMITSLLGSSKKQYMLQKIGFFKYSFSLQDKEGRQLLTIAPDYKWNSLRYNYNILTSDDFENFEHKLLMLTSVAYCIKYYMAQMAAIVAAT